jgi:hypothetical protein
MPVVTSFFLSEGGNPILIVFPITAEIIKIDIIKPIDTHLLSSPSID